MAHGVASCAMLALLLAAGASARGGRSLLQNAQAPGTAATFPYYGTCDQLVDDNMFSLSNAISVTDTPAGKRVCVPVDYNPGCPQTVVRNGQTIPNYCCVDYTAGGILVQPNVYKFEMQVKSNCRNAILYGASNDGPKVLRGDGSTGQLALNWEATDTVIGTIQKARFTNVGITAANAAGSQICFTIDKNFNKGSGECDTVEELCLSGKGNCGGDMTIVESDKNPRPTGLKSHLCCPVQDPPTCMDVLPGGCSAPNKQGPNWSTVVPEGVDATTYCCVADCNSADATFNCPTGSKDNGQNPMLSIPVTQAEYTSSCCTPTTCSDAGQTCGAGSRAKPGMSSILLPNFNNFQSVCCEQDCNSADNVYDCSSALKDNGANPALSWPLSQSQYDSSCCTPTLCPDANTQCQPGSVRKSGYTSILLPNLGQHQSVCCEQDCNSADSVYDCSAGLKDNGANPTLSWPLSQASYDSQCCTPTLCGDAGRTCAAGTDEKPNIASILLPNFNNFQSVCCEQDCDSADRVLNCGAGLKDNGRNSALAFPLSQAEYDSKCCEVTVCPDAQMACDASTERKPGYATIPLPNFANFQATCCQQSCNTADNVFDCSSANKDNGANPALPFPITQTIYDSYCCTPKLCPDQLPRGCEPPTVFANAPGFETTPAPSPDTATDICCIPLLEQKYPFPYCRCEGSFNASINADNQYAPASGDSFRADQANPGSDILLPFRLTPGSVAMSDTVNEYCFNLHFLGTETPTNPKNIRQWCRAQSTLQRIEFLSSRDCSKDKYSVVFRTTYEGQEVELPMGVEDQWEDQNTGILKFNRVQHPINGALFTPFGAEDRTDVFPAVLGFTPKDSGYVKAAAKVVKIGDYLDKGMGFAIGSGQGMSALLASKGGNPGSTEAPVALGSMCIRLKTANTACSNLASFCGGYFADGYDSLAPGTATNFRCQWALMESRNQRCCPVQTTLETSV